VSWDLRRTDGRHVDAGVYFVRFTAGAFVRSERFVVVH
jgi:hypothetical protein